jgi:hypothetical protein
MRHGRQFDGLPAEDAPVGQPWPEGCRACGWSGWRQIAWHHLDDRGEVAVREVVGACDCALGVARVSRQMFRHNDRPVQVRDAWSVMGGMRAMSGHIEVYLDPTPMEKLTPAQRAAPRQASRAAGMSLVAAHLPERRNAAERAR